MKFCRVFFLTLCVVSVCAIEQNKDVVRDKRTLDIILKALAETLGYNVAKRPMPMPLPKPAAGPRSGVNPAMAPAAPAPKSPPPPPKIPPPPPPAPKAPAPAPRLPPPKAPVPPMPKAPAPPMKMAAPPQQAGPLAKARFPTVPPLLTETIQKMFNINFNWNKNAQPLAVPAPAPQVPVPAPKAPAPAPKAPVPAPAPKAPVPSAPKSTAAPGKILYYDYDEPHNTPFVVSLRDYDGYYNYDSDNAQQEQPLQEEKQELQQQQPREEEQNQNIQNEEQKENVQPNGDTEQLQDKQIDDYQKSVQNFWATSPWNNHNYENYNSESSAPEQQFSNPHFGKHDFFINHPSGSSYARMELKKPGQIKTNEESENYQVPMNYYTHSNEPQQVKNNEGPTFDQYYYVLDNEKQQPQSDSHTIEINNNGEQGIKEPLRTEKEYQASVPIPLHVINQENPFMQWVSIEQAGSENQPKKLPLKIQSQKVQKTEKQNTPLYEFNYQPEHYVADFIPQTIPPPTQQDYANYNPEPFKLEEELSDKATIKEQQYGRKYTTVHADNVVHNKY